MSETNPRAGYYSFVQYVPDTCAMEACNVGVILVCEETGEGGMECADSIAELNRVASFFGESHASDSTLAAIKAFSHRLKDGMKSTMDIIDAVGCLCNSIRITDPRPIKIYDIAKNRRDLFETYVLKEDE